MLSFIDFHIFYFGIVFSDCLLENFLEVLKVSILTDLRLSGNTPLTSTFVGRFIYDTSKLLWLNWNGFWAFPRPCSIVETQIEPWRCISKVVLVVWFDFFQTTFGKSQEQGRKLLEPTEMHRLHHLFVRHLDPYSGLKLDQKCVLCSLSPYHGWVRSFSFWYVENISRAFCSLCISWHQRFHH